ncbi:hypothetical protein [Rhizobium rhizogenes]|uniref:hypothetical protein n=1 Tax=Rhizobium rhizogenes TaxID=359 RepID=UPI0022BB8F32|nr:hypothetical protein [Rhizobium rhizogenes]MCZ7486148.1 hypothetical protein [Rhizobium rhizogenes]
MARSGDDGGLNTKFNARPRPARQTKIRTNTYQGRQQDRLRTPFTAGALLLWFRATIDVMGRVPIFGRTGGLAETIINANGAAIEAGLRQAGRADKYG